MKNKEYTLNVEYKLNGCIDSITYGRLNKDNVVEIDNSSIILMPKNNETVYNPFGENGISAKFGDHEHKIALMGLIVLFNQDKITITEIIELFEKRTNCKVIWTGPTNYYSQYAIENINQLKISDFKNKGKVYYDQNSDSYIWRKN